MDLEDAGSGTENVGRTEAFQQGTSVGQSRLSQDSANFNAQVPTQSMQTSVLQPYMSSGNGMSAQDASLRIPGMPTVMTPNGSSQDSYEQARYMRIQGRKAF